MPLDLPPGDREAPDAGLLDAYSHAVSGAVARVAPAVAHVRVERARHGRGREGSGSGFLITPDGYLVTNSHMASGAAAIEVTLPDGRTASAQIVGDDPDSDLAVLKMAASDFAWIRFGDSSGVRVETIERGSPTTQAGFVRGDVIVALDGAPVPDVDTLVRLLAADAIARPIAVLVVRRDRTLTLTATPVESAPRGG